MNKLLLPAFISIFLFSCTETVKTETEEIVNTKDLSMSASSSCEQVDFSNIPASNLNLFTTTDTVFNNYDKESILIHIPDGTSISGGDNMMKILLQSSNYSAVNSIEKSKINKDGVNCLYNYIVLDLKMNSSSPSGQPIKYEMSVPITLSEWNTADFIMLQVDGEIEKVLASKVGDYPKEVPEQNN